jgi:hypothetical protein
MPHYRAKVEGMSMEDVDAALREARVGVVTAGDVDNATTASGIPDEEPSVESVKVSVDASDPDEAKRRLEEALPGASSVEVLG